MVAIEWRHNKCHVLSGIGGSSGSSVGNNVTIDWAVTHCSLIDIYRRFGGT
jgi:hypothetical protein